MNDKILYVPLAARYAGSHTCDFTLPESNVRNRDDIKWTVLFLSLYLTYIQNIKNT